MSEAMEGKTVIVSLDDIWPLTIVSDRYYGSYSGAKYLAFNLDSDCIPDAIGGGDSEEHYFFKNGGEHIDFIIGKGDTPDLAAYDLYYKINQQ